ncbi:MAG: UbiA family prenyltransferase [Desulfobacteraceae bacterium]|nr:UbiA family prenyltransferase [Desulfobacteraceae bacterium]
MTVDRIKEYARFCRVEYLGFSCGALFGALSVAGRDLEINKAIILFIINMLFIVWGFVHNDYCDIRYDSCSEDLRGRPLVKGSVTKNTAVFIMLVCIILSFGLTFFFSGFLPFFALGATFFLAAIYNMYSKKVPGSDFFYAVSASFLCLFGALAVLEKGAGMQSLGWLTWIVITILFVEHLFFNIEGSLKDVVVDTNSGALTTPIRLGVYVKNDGKFVITKKFKLLFYFLKIITITIIFTPFIFFDFIWYKLQLFFLVLIAIKTLLCTKKILDLKVFNREKIGHLSVYLENVSKPLISIMLVGHIGVYWMLFFFLTPRVWFLVSNYIINNRFITPPKTF